MKKPHEKRWDMQLVSWKDIKSDVKKLNITLFNIMEEINPPASMKLILAEYPYGTLIVDDGLLTLCNDQGDAIPINDPDFPRQVKESLSYASITLGFLLNKSSEVYIKLGARNVPLNMLHPGKFLGLFEVVSAMTNSKSIAIWNVCSGARSAMLLPKISDTTSHRRLKNTFSPMALP